MAVYNISINQGESYNLDATLVSSSGTSVNLSGYYLRGQARYSYGSTGVLLDLSPTITNATGGAINLTLTPAQTANLPVTIAVYDIEIKNQDAWTKQRRIKNDLNRFNMYELPNRTNRYGRRRNN